MNQLLAIGVLLLLLLMESLMHRCWQTLSVARWSQSANFHQQRCKSIVKHWMNLCESMQINFIHRKNTRKANNVWGAKHGQCRKFCVALCACIWVEKTLDIHQQVGNIADDERLSPKLDSWKISTKQMTEEKWTTQWQMISYLQLNDYFANFTGFPDKSNPKPPSTLSYPHALTPRIRQKIWGIQRYRNGDVRQ